MNPYSAYSSLKKKKRIFQFGLTVMVAVQLIFWGCINLNIPVHNSLIELIIKPQLPDEFKVDLKGTKVSFPDQFSIEELLILNPNGNKYRFKNLKLNIKYSNLFFTIEDALSELSFKEFEFNNYEKPNFSLKSKNGKIQKISDDKVFLDLVLNSTLHELNLLGIIELRKSHIPENIISRIQQGDESSYVLPKFLKDEIGKSSPIVLDTLLIQNESLNFSFVQKIDSKKNQCIVSKLQGYTTLYKKFDDYISKTSLMSDGIFLNSSVQKLQINDPVFNINGYFKNGLNDITGYSVVFSKTSTILSGPVNGTLPHFFTSFVKDNARTKGYIISDSNCSQVSLSFEKEKNEQYSIFGEAKFTPDRFDCYVQKHNKLLKIIDGKGLNFHFYENIDSRKENFPGLFRIIGKELSVLETPYGQFSINGETDREFNVNLKNSFGKIGSSEVNLSYTQNWEPLQYKFVVDGYSIPTDIINWMPPWWESLWQDFKFTKETPKGSFTIKGIWGGPVGNSRTNGFVETKSLEYKNLPITSSSIWVTVDDKSTSVTGKEIFHDQGKMKGFLKFPRKNMKSSIFLNFKFDGDFPLDQGKQVFGENVYKYLHDINSSKVECVASGKIIRKESNESDEYQLSLRSEKGGIFKGIPFDSLRGKIIHQNNKTIGYFDPLQVVGGSSKLSYESVEHNDSSTLSFNFDLKDANSSRFIKVISDLNPQNSDSFIHDNMAEDEQSKERDGKLNLMVQAKGPPSDFLQFEGTGSLKLFEKGLSQINLLGGISRELAKFTILPSGAFTFEELDAPFKINHGMMTFDDFRLTGPISSIDGSGDLDLTNGKLDLISKINFAGNIPIPGLRQLVNLADPISKIFEVKINGTISDPTWNLVINPVP